MKQRNWWPRRHNASRLVNLPHSGPTQQHCLMLDALRGVAAVAVALYHACIIFGGAQLLPKGFLAVDFFFLLSGVVVAHAYEQRLKQGQLRDYFERRVVRLYPMILFGALLGMSVLITGPAARLLSTGTLTYLGLSAALCLPIVKANVYPGNHSIAPVNGPSWSLFFEIFVNAVYGVAAKRLITTTKFLVWASLSAFIVEAIGIFRFNGAHFGAYVEDFEWGFVRVIFPFFTGVLINRIFPPRMYLMSTMTPLLLAIALAATFYMPTSGVWSAFSELIAIAVIYPCVIVLALRVVVSSRQGRVFAWLGAVSYPVYAIHGPLFMWLSRMQRVTVSRFQVSPYWWIVLAVAFAIVCAWAIYKIYDLPLRAVLTTTLKLRHRALVSAGTA
jgi:peptidoglycan/LPS O-acetylase OafA/YrhL